MSTRISETTRIGKRDARSTRHPSESWGIPVGACRDPNGEIPAFARMTDDGSDTGSSKTVNCLLCLAILSLPLAACGPGKPSSTKVAHGQTAKQAKKSAGDPRIPCARGPAALERVCTIEQAKGETGTILTIRHPDGAFRRLLVTHDGRGVVAADGAEVAKVGLIEGNGIEVMIGDARYRLPATVKSATKPS